MRSAILILISLWARLAFAESVDAGVYLTKVDGARATIAHGKRAGLKLGDVGELYAPLPTHGVDNNLRIARGKIIAITDDSATLALDSIAATVPVGAWFNLQLAVPDAIAGSAVLRFTAIGVEVEDPATGGPLITLEQLLADPAAGPRALDAMIANVVDMRDIISSSLTTPFADGPYRGKTAAQVIDKLDRAQVEEFLWFVASVPVGYLAKRWKFPEIFFTWILNNAPSGQRWRLEHETAPFAAAAKTAIGAGKLDAARASWRQVLAKLPDDKDALKAVADIDQCLRYARIVASDPDDTATLYKLASLLLSIHAYPLVGERLAALDKRKYEPVRVEQLRGLLLIRQYKFADGERVLATLARQHPDDKDLANSLAYARAEAKIARDPKNPAGALEMADNQAGSKYWGQALYWYRNVLELERATPAQREAARKGQAKVAQLRDAEELLGFVRSELARHELASARDHLEKALALVDDKATVLAEIAELARTLEETELALELAARRVAAAPRDQAARTALAFAQLGDERYDEAEATVKAALELDGDHAYAWLIRSWIAQARGDLAAMAQHAEKASANSPKYAWPFTQLARAAAARGDWDAALAQAKKAWELGKDLPHLQNTLSACNQGQRAAEALKASPNSARERLRLVRALARLGLPTLAAVEIAKLPADARADAWWAVAVTPDSRVDNPARLDATRKSAPTTEFRKRALALSELTVKLHAQPSDPTRLALARLQLEDGSFDAVLATVGPVKTGATDLAADARAGLQAIADEKIIDAAFAHQDFADALARARKNQQVYDRIGARYARINARQRVATALEGLHQFSEELAMLEDARKLAVELGDPDAVAIAEQRIGSARALTGTTDSLRKALVQSVQACEQLDDELACYWVGLQLSRIELDDGHFSLAIEAARRSWTSADRVGHLELARQARGNLAEANLTANRLTDAEALAKALLVDSRGADDTEHEQLSLMILGAVAMQRAEGAAARARFQEVYDLGLRTGDTGWRATARQFEGISWQQADHLPAKAIASLGQASELLRALGEGNATQHLGSVLSWIADAQLQLGKIAEARAAASEALAIAVNMTRASEIAPTKTLLARVAIAEKRGDEAAALAKEALALAKTLDDDSTTWNAWYAAARAAELQGKDDVAVDAYEHALEAVGRMLQAAGGDADRNGFFGTGHIRELYTSAVDRLLKVGKTQRAMEVLDLSRDALLKQKFDATKVQPKDPAVRAKLDKADQARAHVIGLQKQLQQSTNAAQQKALGEQIAKSRQELNQVVLDLKVGHRQLFQALAMDPQNLVGRRADLPKGSVLVEYFVAEDALYAFVVSAALAQPAVVKVPIGAAELEKTVSQWRAAIVKQKADALGAKLGDWLLAPLKPHLAGATTLIVLPFGPLYYVPFDALMIDGHYAIEDYRFAMETASTLEHVLRPARPHGSGTLLAISNPDGSLPGAQAEVTRIVKSAVPDARVLVRKDATVEKFRELAGSYRFLHLATHGILDADPRKTYLKLANGPLTVEQIVQLQGLDQANELVVLSACDTAMEEGKSTGDELVSVASGFSMAGAPALIASLWAVSDESTAELMASFYKAIDQAQGDRLDALRAAKLALLHGKSYATPWHWAAFQLYGDYR